MAHGWVALLLGASLLLLACQKDVEPEKMKAVADWSSAMCACAKKAKSDAKACAAKLGIGPLSPQEFGSLGPKYNVEQMKQWTNLDSVGMVCEVNINNM
jgi:hypothetical protein